MARPLKGIASFPLLALALSAVLAACAPAAEAPAAAPVEIRFAMQPYLSYAPFYIAQEEGFFEQQGLRVSFVPLPGASEQALALAQGELDAGATFLSAGVLNAISESGNIRMVSDKGYLDAGGCTVNAVLAQRELVEQDALATAAGWQGARVAYDPSTLEGYALELLLSPLGLVPDDVVPLDLPPPVELDAFAEGSLQVTLTSEPWLTRHLNTGNVAMVQPMEQLMPGFQFAVNLFGPSLLDQDRQAGARFLAAYLQAVRQLQQGKTERNLELLAEFTELEPDLLRQACWPAFRADGQVDIESVMTFHQWTIDSGLAATELTPDQVYDPTFLDEALQLLDS